MASSPRFPAVEDLHMTNEELFYDKLAELNTIRQKKHELLTQLMQLQADERRIEHYFAKVVGRRLDFVDKGVEEVQDVCTGMNERLNDLTDKFNFLVTHLPQETQDALATAFPVGRSADA